MTTPTVVPGQYNADATDFLKVKRDTFGAVRTVTGTVTVPSGVAADENIGLVPFQAGATFTIDDKSVHCGDFGAGTTTVDLGIIYDDDTNNTNDANAWAEADTAPQSGGFVTVTEIEGLTLKTTANGWLALTVRTAATDAEADVTFSVQVKYD